MKVKCESRTELVRQSYKVRETNVWEQSRIIENHKKESV